MKTLDKIERQVLLKQYMQSGLNFYEAKDKLDKFHDYLRAMQDRLRATGKSDLDINKNFREEFFKISKKLEV